MDQTGTQFLPRSALSLDQHWHIGFCDHLQLAPDQLHLLGLAEEYVHWRKIDLSFVVGETYGSHSLLSLEYGGALGKNGAIQLRKIRRQVRLGY